MSVADFVSLLAAAGGTVSGVRHSYSYDEIPEVVHEFPSILNFPDSGEDDVVTFAGSTPGDRDSVYRAKAQLGVTPRTDLPTDLGVTTPYIDSYLTAVRGDANINQAYEVGRIAWRIVTFEWGQVMALGIEFVVEARELL